jgi:hypothetical protein
MKVHQEGDPVKRMINVDEFSDSYFAGPVSEVIALLQGMLTVAGPDAELSAWRGLDGTEFTLSRPETDAEFADRLVRESAALAAKYENEEAADYQLFLKLARKFGGT